MQNLVCRNYSKCMHVLTQAPIHMSTLTIQNVICAQLKVVDNKLETWARGRQQADEYQPLVHFVLKPLALVIKFTCLPCLTLASVARHLVTTDHDKRGNRVWYLVLVDIVCTKRPNHVMSSQPPPPPPPPHNTPLTLLFPSMKTVQV